METLFQIANLFVLPFWALMIFLPRWQGTRKLIGSPLILVPLPLAYALLIVPQRSALGPLLINPNLANIAAALGRSDGALVGWIHFLAFDLFVGRWVYLDSRDQELSPLLMAPILFLTLMLGPCGLLVYLAVRRLWGKRTPGSSTPPLFDALEG